MFDSLGSKMGASGGGTGEESTCATTKEERSAVCHFVCRPFDVFFLIFTIYGH